MALLVNKHESPHMLRVGGLYQLYWRNAYGNTEKSPTALRLITVHVGRAGKYQQTVYVREPVLVIDLDMYVCRVLAPDGQCAWFSYSYYADTREYIFREVKADQ